MSGFRRLDRSYCIGPTGLQPEQCIIVKAQSTRLGRREFLKRTTRATVAVAVSGGMASAAVPLAGRAGATEPPRASRICYYRDGEIHVSEIGKPEGKPLTTGHWDFKPSWSKTGDMLVCLRRLKDDPVTVNWKPAIFVINTDGTGFHTLSDGTHTDFNPTWTRDGRNTPIWNRKNDKAGGFYVMQGKVGGKLGEEVAITDDRSRWRIGGRLSSPVTSARLALNRPR